MHWIAVDRVDIALFVVIKDTISPERTSAYDMAIGQDIACSAWISQYVVLGEYDAPLSASTTNPVASLEVAGSVSKEQVWQKCIDTTRRTTFSIVACHSAVSAVAGARGTSEPSSPSLSMPYKGLVVGVSSPSD